MKADKSVTIITVLIGFVFAVVGLVTVRPVLAQEASSSVAVNDSSSTPTVRTRPSLCPHRYSAPYGFAASEVSLSIISGSLAFAFPRHT